jgi:hypothetical protein
MNVARYIRWGIATGLGVEPAWCQIQVYNGSGTNIAANCNATPNQNMNALGTYTTVSAGATTLQLTNGNAGGLATTSCLYYGGGGNFVIDLGPGGPYTIASIALWFWPGTSYGGVELDFSTDSTPWHQVFGPQTVPMAGFNTATGYVIAIPQCFVAGTHIATPRGERVVQDICQGDEVLTHDGRTVAVAAVRRDAVQVRGALRLRPVRIPQGVLGALRPLRLTDRHGVLFEGQVVPAYYVPGAEREPSPTSDEDGIVEYHHLALAHPSDLLLAEGVPCESLRL